MEVAVIDWKSIDTRFVRDELFENINAPKWVDFLSIDDNPVDDEAWFCRPSKSFFIFNPKASAFFLFLDQHFLGFPFSSIADCNHPKTVDDFFRERKSPLSNYKVCFCDFVNPIRLIDSSVAFLFLILLFLSFISL